MTKAMKAPVRPFISVSKVAAIREAALTPTMKESAMGGLEGAESIDRETVNWFPSFGSADQIINDAKPMADARSRDMVSNDGYLAGASAIHKDNIVGNQFRLIAKPDWEALGVSEAWAEVFQRYVESKFTAIAESPDNWLDASRRNTLTGMLRLDIGCFMTTGEVLSTVEWIKDDPSRPCKTAIQSISPDRLSNPYGEMDSPTLRRGVVRDSYGAPQAYHIRKGHPSETTDFNSYQWVKVPAKKPWGRQQVIHIIEQMTPDQTRGIGEMVSALKQMKMHKKFSDVVLQNAVINASYAAAIESELPTAEVFQMMGATAADPIAGMNSYIGNYMAQMAAYSGNAKNMHINGSKMVHLFPGTKLNLKPVGNNAGMGSNFEQSLLRHIAASLGLSYEQLSRDYTQTNYSSARASMNEMWKGMQSRKKLVADTKASSVYRLWLEEDINAGFCPLPEGKSPSWFYEPMVKDFLCQCSWIGASRGQIDETKETAAALARIDGGLSTYEIECARLSTDFRKVFKQRYREKLLQEQLGLNFNTDTGKNAQRNIPDNQTTEPTPAKGTPASKTEDTSNA